MLLVLQKDLGSALIFFMTYMVMLYIATSNEFLFFLGMGAASVAAMGAYKLFSHVQVRVADGATPGRILMQGDIRLSALCLPLRHGGCSAAA